MHFSSMYVNNLELCVILFSDEPYTATLALALENSKNLSPPVLGSPHGTRTICNTQYRLPLLFLQKKRRRRARAWRINHNARVAAHCTASQQNAAALCSLRVNMQSSLKGCCTHIVAAHSPEMQKRAPWNNTGRIKNRICFSAVARRFSFF